MNENNPIDTSSKRIAYRGLGILGGFAGLCGAAFSMAKMQAIAPMTTPEILAGGTAMGVSIYTGVRLLVDFEIASRHTQGPESHFLHHFLDFGAVQRKIAAATICAGIFLAHTQNGMVEDQIAYQQKVSHLPALNPQAIVTHGNDVTARDEFCRGKGTVILTYNGKEMALDCGI